MGERDVCTVEVVGSNPIGSTIICLNVIEPARAPISDPAAKPSLSRRKAAAPPADPPGGQAATRPKFQSLPGAAANRDLV